MKTFIITDGKSTETASTLTDATEICERWCDSLQAKDQLTAAPPPDLNGSSLTALNASIATWVLGITRQSGKKIDELKVFIQDA